MGDKTDITWTDATWNLVTGCTKISPGCANCYAERETAGRLGRLPAYAELTDERGHWTGEVRLHPDRLDEPYYWRRPRMIFVNSMSDLFHPEVPFDFIADVFDMIGWTGQHIFQALTKRPRRIEEFYAWDSSRCSGRLRIPYDMRPLPNLWLGVSVEDQERADERISILRGIPAAVRFVSVEPLLGQIQNLDLTGIDWVIVGGESGPSHQPMEIAWLIDIVAQCQAASVSVWVKQDAALHPGTQGRIPDELWALKQYPVCVPES